MHIPDDPLFYEKFYFTPGDLGFGHGRHSSGKSACSFAGINRYPEAARLTALQGAEILFYPTAIGWHPAEKEKYGVNNIRRGKRSSAVTRSPTVVTLRR